MKRVMRVNGPDPTGFALVNVEDELSALVGRKVDLHTPGSLSKYFRDRVVREAQDQYVRA